MIYMKRFIIICLCFFYYLISIYSNDEMLISQISKMNFEEKAAQVLMMSVEGKNSFPSYLTPYFESYIPGAFILFGYNFSDTAEGCASYIESVDQSMRELSKSKEYIPPFFASDFEGGYVYRIRKIGSPLPAAKKIAETLNEEDAFNLYRYTAEQISLLGIHLNLAPIAEKETSKNKTFFDDRIFSVDEDILVKYSKIFLSAMEKSGVMCAVKHFPGTGADPHLYKSIIDVSEEKFYKEFISPFRRIIYDTDGVVLISHAEIPFIEKLPFCFSSKGIDKLLRKELKFKGLIITDDMAMKALKRNGKTTSDNVIEALSAGCDMVMCSEPVFKELVRAIADKMKKDSLFETRINKAVFNILKIKIKMRVIDEACMPIKIKSFDKEKFYKAKTNAENILKK